MKEKPYMSSWDLLEWLKIACLAGEAKVAAEETKKNAKTDKEKDWAKRMAIAATNLSKVTDERLECLDKDQVKTVKRRRENSDLRLYTVDQLRVEDRTKPAAEDRTICYDDWCLVGEMALLHCDMCPQGEHVKNCEYRKAFHRIGFPVGRTKVKDGQCEFRVDDYMHIILPQGGDKAAEEIRKLCIKMYKDAEAAEAAKKAADEDKRLFL